MKKAVPFLVLFASLSAYASPAAPKPAIATLGKSAVEFKATGHPSALNIVGKGEALAGDLALKGNQVTGQVAFDLKSLNTGIAMRDEHMKNKYLEVEKYPQAKLTITDLKLPESAAGGGDFPASDVPFKGTLSLHGVEKPVQGTATVARNGASGTATATFGIKITDYGIAVPSFAGITVADDVLIKVDTNASFKQ